MLQAIPCPGVGQGVETCHSFEQRAIEFVPFSRMARIVELCEWKRGGVDRRWPDAGCSSGRPEGRRQANAARLVRRLGDDGDAVLAF